MRHSTSLIFALSVVMLWTGLKAEPTFEGWKLESDIDGIKVYSRAIDGSQFRQVKAVASVAATIESVKRILTDYDNYEQWMNNIADSEVIEQAAPNIAYVYTYEDAPWPVQNRFCVSKVTLEESRDDVTLEFESVPRYMKSPRDAIEFLSYKGHWHIHRSKNGCDIEYFLEADPGGYVPSWLMNHMAYGGPARSLKNLRTIAETTRRP